MHCVYIKMKVIQIAFLYFWLVTCRGGDVHLFYYAWYGNPEHDDGWKHWDHEVLPHWEKRINEKYPSVGTRHDPPRHIHSPFYPLRNAYSSRDHEVIRQHLREIHDAGGTVAVVSWWGQASKKLSTDTQNVCSDLVIRDILQVADEQSDVKIAFHLEPYPGRLVENVAEDVKYIFDHYGRHSSFYRSPQTGLPLFYVYDSYHIFPSQWSRMLQPDGDLTIRGTIYDAAFVGLWLEHFHGRDLFQGGFNGFYTYFATDGFSHGSSTSNWPAMCQFAEKHNMMCILSVGPGYNDTSIRPWNAHNTRSRRDGAYFEEMWQKALDARPTHVRLGDLNVCICITSYNEWGEGTQIESVRNVDLIEEMGKEYLDYGVHGPYKYIHINAEFSRAFRSQARLEPSAPREMNLTSAVGREDSETMSSVEPSQSYSPSEEHGARNGSTGEGVAASSDQQQEVPQVSDEAVWTALAQAEVKDDDDGAGLEVPRAQVIVSEKLVEGEDAEL